MVVKELVKMVHALGADGLERSPNYGSYLFDAPLVDGGNDVVGAAPNRNVASPVIVQAKQHATGNVKDQSPALFLARKPLIQMFELIAKRLVSVQISRVVWVDFGPNKAMRQREQSTYLSDVDGKVVLLNFVVIHSVKGHLSQAIGFIGPESAAGLCCRNFITNIDAEFASSVLRLLHGLCVGLHFSNGETGGYR